MEPERWKDIKGYEGRYQVSSRGRVRSIMRNIFTQRADRSLLVSKQGKTLTPYRGRDGALYVNLYDDRHRRHVCNIKRLMAQAFIPCIF